MTNVPTKKDALAALAYLGITGAAALLVDAHMGGPAFRHRARVSAALDAALLWIFGATFELAGTTDPEILAHVWWVLSLEASGVGGNLDLQGDSTLRHPALAKLGKGRKEATDGPAWSAAIREALELVQGLILEARPGQMPDVWPCGVEHASIYLQAGQETVGAIFPKLGEVRWWRAEIGRRLLADVAAERPARWGETFNTLSELQRRWANLPAWVQDLCQEDPSHAIEHCEELARHPEPEGWRREVFAKRPCVDAVRFLVQHQGLALDELLPLAPREHIEDWIGWLEDGGLLRMSLPAIYHGDHDIPPGLIAWVVARQAPGLFAVTVDTEREYPCGLFGPAMGDNPIEDGEVTLVKRSPDRPPSRLVPYPRRTRGKITVIGARGATVATSQVFTAYGGPLAPREPGDPSLVEGSPEHAESVAFWAQHALSMPAEVAEAMRRDREALDARQEAAEELP